MIPMLTSKNVAKIAVRPVMTHAGHAIPAASVQNHAATQHLVCATASTCMDHCRAGCFCDDNGTPSDPSDDVLEHWMEDMFCALADHAPLTPNHLQPYSYPLQLKYLSLIHI